MNQFKCRAVAIGLIVLALALPRWSSAEGDAPALSGGTVAGAVTIDGKSEVKGFKLQEAVIYLQSKAPPVEPASTKRQIGATINQKDKVYTPHVVAIPAGSIVEFNNSDAELHNVHSESTENPEFNAASVPGGAPVKKFFPKSEVVKLTCNVHPDMLAFIVVCPDAHFAMANTTGAYEIAGVPPGQYTVTLWHEKFEPVSQEISVKAGEKLAVNFPLERSKAIRRR